MFFFSVKPKIFDWKDTVNVAVSASHEIDCVSTANPPANVTWYSFDENNNTVYMYSRLSVIQLTFGNVRQSDAGLYMCIATNKFGTILKYVNVIVKGTGNVCSQINFNFTFLFVFIAEKNH